ncbi:MAG: hypothetical protein IJX08_08400 [Clostridia bacterium]|nr:hypothetical protein [Clostridia bacterium]
MNLDEAKRYKDPDIILIRVCCAIWMAFVGLSAILTYPEIKNGNEVPLVMLCLLIVISAFLAITISRIFGTIEVSRYAITWRCLFHKTVTISVADCVSVGIYHFSRKPIGSPQVYTYFIYLSKEPLSKKAKEKLTAKAPKEGLIWFPYSDELCLHLIKVLPVSKTRSLEGFYNQRQDEKRELEKIKAKRKRRKEKEKQKKREQQNKK